MGRILLLATVLLPVGSAYAQPYPPPGYPLPLPFPMVVVDPFGSLYPGYAYNDGAPTLLIDGILFPLIFLGDEWGYYDPYHVWHRAPDAVYRHLEERRRAGVAFRTAPPPHPMGGAPGRAVEGRPAVAPGGRPPEPGRAASPPPRPVEPARAAPPPRPAPAPAGRPAPGRENEHEHRE